VIHIDYILLKFSKTVKEMRMSNGSQKYWENYLQWYIWYSTMKSEITSKYVRVYGNIGSDTFVLELNTLEFS